MGHFPTPSTMSPPCAKRAKVDSCDFTCLEELQHVYHLHPLAVLPRADVMEFTAVWKPLLLFLETFLGYSNYALLPRDVQDSLFEGLHDLVVYKKNYEPSAATTAAVDFREGDVEGSDGDAYSIMAQQFRGGRISLSDLCQYDVNSRYGTGDEISCWLHKDDAIDVIPHHCKIKADLDEMPFNAEDIDEMITEYNT